MASLPFQVTRKVNASVSACRYWSASLTLIASALGWVSLPSTLVEVLIAVSVGVSAVHAMRPLVRSGEEVIAGAFGLAHGLAFTGIHADLGLTGSTSLPTLLAFNVGFELAQPLTVALIVPLFYLASRTRYFPAPRLAGAEDAVIAHPWWVVAGLARLALIMVAGSRVTGPVETRRVLTRTTVG